MLRKIKNRIIGFCLITLFLPLVAFGEVVIPRPDVKGETVFEALEAIAGFLFWIATPIFTIVVLISAFLMMTAGGDAEKFGKGKKTLIYAALAYLIILSVFALPGIIRSIFETSP